MTQGEATTTASHAAPPEAWDAIAEGYDRYVSSPGGRSRERGAPPGRP